MFHIDLMREQECDLLMECIDSFENGDFTIMPQDKWTLQDVEDSIQARLDFLSKGGLDDDEINRDWLPCYVALAQVKQAQALQQVAQYARQIALTLQSLDDNSIVTREK